jgi:hypothetical protein
MSNRRYASGSNFERKFLQELASGEYHLYAVRSAGSHGALDIVEIRLPAYHPGGYGKLEVWGYQLKYGRHRPRFSSAELDYLRFLGEYINVRIVWKAPWVGRKIYTVDEFALKKKPVD